MMAEALASSGHDVTVWTNNLPVFTADFVGMPGHELLDIRLSPGFQMLPSGSFDVVVLVPHRGHSFGLFDKALYLALNREARLVLLNFESPNWFNALSPEPRDPALWDGWLKVSQGADMILSLAGESTRFGKDFYANAPSGALFRHCYPAINTPVADALEPVRREKQIVCITRFGATNTHKGGQELLKAIGPAMAGHALAIVVGSGAIDVTLLGELTRKAEQSDVTLRFLCQLSDQEKFREIKRSVLMVFLSFFEGFGYPPVEALYCDTPCIVYDLPVLREVGGDALIYVPPGDGVALQNAIRQVLSGRYQPPVVLSEHIAPVAPFEAYADRLDDLMQELASLPNQPGVTNISASIRQRWRRRLLLEKAKGLARPLRVCAAKVMQRILPRPSYRRLRGFYRRMR
jgi:glycosyltransferase involved in cell wall biosynthesis